MTHNPQIPSPLATKAEIRRYAIACGIPMARNGDIPDNIYLFAEKIIGYNHLLEQRRKAASRSTEDHRDLHSMLARNDRNAPAPRKLYRV